MMLWVVLGGCIPDGCGSDVECGSSGICWAGQCEPVLDRAWEVEIAAAEVGWTHPDGFAWDPDTSAPDLFVDYGPSVQACETSPVIDDFTPVWYERCSFLATGEPSFVVGVWDDDGATTELAAEWTWSGEQGFVELALAAAGREVAFVDPSGTVVLWMSLWPGARTDP